MKMLLKKLFGMFLMLAVLVGFAVVPAVALDISEEYPTDENSPLKDLTICFYGDSVCSANCERDTEYADVRGWAGRIGAVTGCTFYNFGVSGASISDCRASNTIMTQLKQTKSQGINPDVIVLHGGVNDAWDAVEVGEVSTGYQYYGKYDTATFASALEQVLSYVDDTFPKATVCYIINFEFLNAQMGERLMDMDEYVDATIEACEKWDIPYLDLYHNEEVVNTLHPHTVSSAGIKYFQNTYLYDFVHPSTEGYDVLYTYIHDFLVELIAPESVPEPEPEPEPDSEAEPEPDSEAEVQPEDNGEQTPVSRQNGSNSLVLILAGIALVAVVAAIVVVILFGKKKETV